MRTFGRKGLTPLASRAPILAPVATLAPEPPRELDEGDPAARIKQAGCRVFELAAQTAAADHGRAQDVLAMLAVTGGFSCIVAAFEEARELGASPQELGMTPVETKDRHRYWFGDASNRYLIDGEDTVIGYALAAVRRHGGVVPPEMAEGMMRRIADGVGGPLFGVPNLSAADMPGDQPINYVRFLWPKFVAALDLYHVPIRMRPSTFGFALRAAIDDLAEPGASPIEMLAVAQIVVECAVPMARLEPARFGF